MGTRFELVLGGLDEPALRAAGEEAIAEILHWHDRLSAFSPGSQLNHICRAAYDRPVPLDDDLFELFATAQEVAQQSGGALDITLGPLMRAHGLRGDGSRESADRQSGGREPVASARARTGMDLIELDEHEQTIRLHARAMELDLGAIAKGFALDRAGVVLREAGVPCALVHGGTSSVVAIGAPPGEDFWRIAIASPVDDDPARATTVDPPPTIAPEQPHRIHHGLGCRGPWKPWALGATGGLSASDSVDVKPRTGRQAASGTGDGLLGLALLRDCALGVSAPTGRMVERGDTWIGHVLDPRTGEPTRAASLAAVVAPSAMLADAWATALLVLGTIPDTLPNSLDAMIAASGDPPPSHPRVLVSQLCEDISA